MQRMPSRGKGPRPQPVHTSKSYSRLDTTSHATTGRDRSESAPIIDPLATASPLEEPAAPDGDVFETDAMEQEREEESEAGDDGAVDTQNDLPIEIQSLMDRFLESLGPIAQQAPLSIDHLSSLYQDFYTHVEAQIATHIAALQTRLSREKSPTPSASSIASSSRGSRKNSRIANKSSDSLSDHQMLTATEVADKRKARRQLELKRIALEEAVERGVCERMYTRLWRHKSTDDDERDEKVRSRAAALKLVGVTLTELLTTAMGDEDSASRKAPSVDFAAAQIEAARLSLESMNDAQYPIGKLKALKATHKNIVEALSQMFPSTSSADEILPTLIYTVIVSSPESLHVVSNIAFIQRFRASSKLDGEAAYCLTNLEAAISFLETVDLSSLRPEESSSKQSSRPSTPRSESFDPMYRGLSGTSPVDSKNKSSVAPQDSKPRPRGLSTILKGAPKPFEGATGAVFESADIAYDKLHNALDGSLKFFFGRIKEKQAITSPDGGPEVAAPKTLEDARKLVDDSAETMDDATSIGGGSALTADTVATEPTSTREPRGKAMELIGGKRPAAARERSAESFQSSSSGRHVAFAAGQAVAAQSGRESPSLSVAATMNPPVSPVPVMSAAESMRNLVTRNLSGWGSMRGFGRPANYASPTATPPAEPQVVVSSAKDVPEVKQKKEAQGFDLSGIGPPIQRFIDLKEPKELNFFDVELLLRDYQRLAGVMRAIQQGQSSQTS